MSWEQTHDVTNNLFYHTSTVFDKFMCTDTADECIDSQDLETSETHWHADKRRDQKDRQQQADL